jgi:hypothetical protein
MINILDGIAAMCFDQNKGAALKLSSISLVDENAIN